MKFGSSERLPLRNARRSDSRMFAGRLPMYHQSPGNRALCANHVRIDPDVFLYGRIRTAADSIGRSRAGDRG
jgi:hypothetical protein